MVTAAPVRAVADTPSPASVTFRGAAPRAHPIPVAAYPAGTPRWVTYDGRRLRVVAVHEPPAPDPRSMALTLDGRRLHVELADGRLLTLLHRRGAWYERAEPA